MPDDPLPYQWHENLDVARELFAHKEECFYRACVNRAYYAAFGVARVAIGLEDARVRGIHDLVISSYFGTGKGLDRDIAQRLVRLREMRESADYDPLPNVSERAADNAIDRARVILEKLQNRPGSPITR